MQYMLAGQSELFAHCTQDSFEHMGVEPEQSLSERHGTQAPSGSQNLPDSDAQSALTAHSTQVALVVLHAGVDPEHCASVVQPATHTKRPGSQMGFAIPQSALLRHCTQTLLAGWQRGSAAGQSAFVPHSTHSCVAGLQTGAVAAEHCDAVMQPTQTPTVVSQIRPFGQPESSLQGAWHWASLGQQA
jgi:hypothetical protein